MRLRGAELPLDLMSHDPTQLAVPFELAPAAGAQHRWPQRLAGGGVQVLLRKSAYPAGQDNPNQLAAAILEIVLHHHCALLDPEQVHCRVAVMADDRALAKGQLRANVRDAETVHPNMQLHSRLRAAERAARQAGRFGRTCLMAGYPADVHGKRGSFSQGSKPILALSIQNMATRSAADPNRARTAFKLL
ncbi:MAG: hypothetical protein NT037_14145 [Hyphomicrobiales bacterium]|nr:hypothetical protein [Hyphomicrobiales bacterium]